MRRFLAGSLLALAFIALPAATLGAGQFSYGVLDSSCDYNPGTWDAGWAVLEVKASEVGKSGANYIRSRTKFEGQTGWDFPWRVVSDTGWQYSSHFANDAATHLYVKNAAYHFDNLDRWALVRVVTRVQIWSDRNGLLSEHTFKTDRC